MLGAVVGCDLVCDVVHGARYQIEILQQQGRREAQRQVDAAAGELIYGTGGLYVDRGLLGRAGHNLRVVVAAVESHVHKRAARAVVAVRRQHDLAVGGRRGQLGRYLHPAVLLPLVGRGDDLLAVEVELEGVVMRIFHEERAAVELCGVDLYGAAHPDVLRGPERLDVRLLGGAEGRIAALP